MASIEGVSTTTLTTVTSTATASSASADDAPEDTLLVIDTQDSLAVSLDRAGERLDELRDRGPADEATATGATLDLDLEGTPAQLSSTEEVNTLPTAFDPREPELDGYKNHRVKTTSDVTVGGVYTGTTDEVYTFVVHRHREMPDKRETKFDVYDQDGKLVDLIAMPAGHPPDEAWETPYGITLSFTAGKLVYGESFTVNLYAVDGSRAEADNPFDGTGSQDPNLEPGLGVTAGSFQVNGVMIDVAADDTITAVLERLSASAAGVVGWFDEGTDTVVLQSLDGDTDIVLDADTSGFLDAMKLSDAVVSGGVGGDLGRPLDQLADLSAVSAGTFRINDIEIAVDPATDSLQDVFDRIAAELPFVEASWDEGAQAVQLTSGGGPMILVDGDSGLLAALGLEDGLYGPPPMTKTQSRKVVAEAKLIANKLEELADREGAQARAAILASIVQHLQHLVPDMDPLKNGRISTAFLIEAADRDAAALLEALAGTPDEHGRGGLIGDALKMTGAEDLSRVDVVA